MDNKYNLPINIFLEYSQNESINEIAINSIFGKYSEKKLEPNKEESEKSKSSYYSQITYGDKE